MKLAKADVGFQSRGVQSKTTYQVAQTAKVMDMFSNMLYKDKIRAVIRELSTNAWDAHVMAGTTDKVPNMHLPSHTDPEFRLRDFGTGLSPAALEEMYQTYGASNKTHSNDFNGCMGIGSKSPFAYANSFVTTSYFNGKKYVYVNAKDRNGMPSMQKMLEEDTNEVNGLEISFAVDRKDIDEFKNKAADLLRRFPKPFKVFCSSTFQLKQDKYFYEGNGWKVRQYDYYNKDSYAIMGNVAYPIDATKFDYQPEDLSEKDKTAWYKHYSRKADNGTRTRKFYTDMLNLGLDIDFEVGEVEMDISREGLQYTKQTVDAIKRKLDDISAKIESEITDSIKNAKCIWEAALKLSELMSGHFRNLRMLVDVDDITYNGKKIPRRFEAGDINESVLVFFHKDSYAKIPKRSDIVHSIDVEPKTAFMIADKKVGNYVAVERFILSNKDKYTNVYLIKPEDTAAKAIKEIKDIVGCTDEYFFYASSVPVPKGTAKKTDTQKVFQFQYKTKGVGYRDSYWKKADVEIKTGGFYVELNNWNTRTNKTDNFKISGYDINDVIELFGGLGITVPEVYGVKSAAIKKFDDHAGWSCFFDWAKTQLENYIKTSNIKDELIELNSYKNWEGMEYFSNALVKLVPKIQNRKSILVETLDSIKNCDKLEKKIGEKVTVLRKVCSRVGCDFPVDSEDISTKKWDQVSEKVYAKYPVLRLMNRWDYGYNEKLKIVVDIVDMIDSCKGN